MAKRRGARSSKTNSTCFPQLDYYQFKRLAKRWIAREFTPELPLSPKQIVMEKIRRKRITAIINLLEAEDVFHVVEAGGLAAGPDGGTEGAVGESVSTRGLVGEFKCIRVDHSVIADNIAAHPKCIPISESVRSPTMPSRPWRSSFSSETCRTSARISQSVAAVPLGASFFRR